jgi:predicted alpha/beta superfamily hydrolase
MGELTSNVSSDQAPAQFEPTDLRITTCVNGAVRQDSLGSAVPSRGNVGRGWTGSTHDGSTVPQPAADAPGAMRHEGCSEVGPLTMTYGISKPSDAHALRIATCVGWTGSLALLALVGCGAQSSGANPDAKDLAVDGASPGVDAAVPISPDATGTCATGPAGVPCVMALHDRVLAGCDPTELAALKVALDARRGSWPLWYAGKALFISDSATGVAGGFNDWKSDVLATTELCHSGLFTAVAMVATGRWPYKFVSGTTWSLDPQNWGFAYDDYTGNTDGRNSILDTYDSGLGHLVQPPDPVCSTALGNCRPLTTYLPAGYDDPANGAKTYPVLFMHDGQNVYDDHTCCFGHTGWEVNVQLDADIKAGLVAPIVVVAADHGGAARNDEYGFSTSVGGKMETFMAFQVQTIQPTAATYWRIDTHNAYVAGSSLGGLVSMRLALAYPTVYKGAAALSGAFWPGQDTHTALADVLGTVGRVHVGIYLDHGGDPSDNSDGAADTDAIRGQMVTLGWTRQDSANCTFAADHVCSYWEPGATHDELAWKARSWRFLRFFFKP